MQRFVKNYSHDRLENTDTPCGYVLLTNQLKVLHLRSVKLKFKIIQPFLYRNSKQEHLRSTAGVLTNCSPLYSVILRKSKMYWISRLRIQVASSLLHSVFKQYFYKPWHNICVPIWFLSAVSSMYISSIGDINMFIIRRRSRITVFTLFI